MGWYVWSNISGGHNAPTCRIYARTKAPKPYLPWFDPQVTTHKSKAAAVEAVLRMASEEAAGNGPVQVNIQGRST